MSQEIINTYLQHPFLIVSFVIACCILFCTALIFKRKWLYRVFRIDCEINEPLNGYISSLGIMNGILLGLLTVTAWEKFDNLDSLVSKESTRIAVLYRNVSVLDDPVKSQVQRELRDYMGFVINELWPTLEQGKPPTMSGGMYFTNITKILAKFEPKTQVETIFLNATVVSLDNLMESRRDRLAAIESIDIPPVFWYLIIISCMINIIMTFFFYFESSVTHALLTSLFVIPTALFIHLLIDLNAPFSGDYIITSDPYQHVLNNFSVYDADKGSEPEKSNEVIHLQHNRNRKNY